MALRETLDADMKTAMREKDQVRLGTIRMVKSAMKYKETEPGAAGPLDDTGILAVIGSELKKRRDAVAEYEKANRADLADKEKAEIEVLQSYLPAQLSEAELSKLVDEAIAEAGAAGPKDMGKVMKVLTPRIQGRADGKVVADLVKQKLAV
ncbi:GatB/YqeY domain-containing protein [Vulgatibacter incomptus]|uniref:Transamidase GatB domain protein n=1 Tax=Vulgatibacter incomptus TaxID=1391653 RepID=A0A0K1P8X3_9BACT|nr:GatB/YqeY domain-containing protein [Vulgatibacter incomptus]AKU89957.1 Transamidase GatB domain protein [Vulgatibacter incomptus]